MADVRIVYLATRDGLVQLANPGKSNRWREIGQALAGQSIRSVATSPLDPLLVYAASAAGLSRSSDGGATWQTVRSDSAGTLAFDGGGAIYAGTDQGLILRSVDGETWEEETAFAAPVVQIAALADGTLLSVGGDGTLCQHGEQGWRPRELHVPQIQGVAASHAEPRRLYVVNRTSLVTLLCTRRLDDPPTGALLVLSGQQEVLLVGTRGALLRSEDEGTAMQQVTGPEHVTALASLPHFIDQAFAGTEAGDLWFSPDRGRSWAIVRAGDSPLQGIAFARAL